MSFINPKFKDFLEKKPEITLIGMAWATNWRFQLVALTIIFIITAFLAGLGVMFE